MLVFSLYQKDKVESLKTADPTELIPPPSNPIRRRMYYIATNFWFDTTINILIVLNMIPITLELSVSEDVSYFIVLRILDYTFCSIFVSEAVLKVRNLSDTMENKYHLYFFPIF